MTPMDCVATAPTVSVKSIDKFDGQYIKYYNPTHLENTITLKFDGVSGNPKITRGESMQNEKPHVQPATYKKSDEGKPAQEFIISKELMDLVTKHMHNKESYNIGDYTITKTTNFERLKNIEANVDQIIDEIMYETVLERKDEVADIPLSEVMNELDVDIDTIMELMDSIEED
ncbi:hypothetical protein [Bacillus cereus]|uniref:hypothetical protein n=1 Tax=Bacillus cereus TaxID=1396 RepID=UPI0002792EBA|nr:hypothetical protein [Bacillus cereus]EJQ20145.1 hypothetical protein IE5_03462 [Bacillus cereus BAG3X2-2]WMW36759.1 hypothetical protein RE433_17925 [Bacillus cereus]SME15184.1 hypothetical protein BACERE00195_03150 [Bacillus cereus]